MSKILKQHGSAVKHYIWQSVPNHGFLNYSKVDLEVSILYFTLASHGIYYILVFVSRPRASLDCFA